MQTIDVSIHIQAPVEQVFDLMIDTEGCPSWLKDVSSAKLLQQGSEAKYGVGAVRSVRQSGITSVEEIVKYDPPNLFEYHIMDSTLPIRHELGRVEFVSSGDGTDVHWVSRAEGRHVWGLLEPILGRSMRKSFKSILEQARAELET
jgi:uncharacterized membrane protein